MYYLTNTLVKNKVHRIEIVLEEIHRRYLRLLGIDTVPAGLAGLHEIIRRHLSAVPFENVSKLLLFDREGGGRFLTLPEFLDGVEQHDLGGTCHSCNPYLAELLRALGYDADLLGADMSQPNVHTCMRVRIDSIPYHVDAGYGGPFREPIRLDRLPHEILEGLDRYVLDREAGGERYQLSVQSPEGPGPGYTVNETPRTHGFFTGAMQGSFKPIATFMNHLRICRIFDDCSVTLLDRTLTVCRGDEQTRAELHTPAGLDSAIANELALPRCPWRDAVRVMERVTGRPFFSQTS